MNEPTKIESVVMARVHRMRYLRMVFSNFTVACLLFAVSLYFIGREVWVAMVFRNAPADLFRVPAFFLSAFLDTRFAVQFLSVVALAALILLARETLRLVASSFVPQGA